METAEIIVIILLMIYVGIGIIFLKVSNRISRDKGEREYPNSIAAATLWFPLLLIIAFVYLESIDFKQWPAKIKRLWKKFPYKKTVGVLILCPFLIYLFLIVVFFLTLNLKILQYGFVIAIVFTVAVVSTVNDKEREAYQKTKKGTA